MHITVEKIKKVINGLKEDLGDGFVDTDIWCTSSNKSVAFHHQHGVVPLYGVMPKHIKLFSQISGILKKTLQESDYPGLGDYYLINLTDDHLVVVLNLRSSTPGTANLATRRNSLGSVGHQQYILVDLSKTSIGILMSIALPNVLENLK